MPSLHKEILTKEQIKLLPLIGKFSKNFGLVGGTAVALQIGHRRSIDFDLFSPSKFGNQSLLNQILDFKAPNEIIVNKLGELTLTLNGVKFTFFRFPYNIVYSENLAGIIKMPSLLTLAAMKAFAIGQRSKWKDYVDMYFILKVYYSVGEISAAGKKEFGDQFNEKLFRSQLAYFDDISYAEPVEFLPGFEIKDSVIKKALVEFSLQ
jgi:hypothetical protein